MSKIYVMGREGHTTVEWVTAPDVGTEQRTAAEELFKARLAEGYAAFRVVPGDALSTAERIETFDPEAERIVLVPRIAGG
ncbi:MAG: hypothetical protein ACRDHG_06230 [Anaerolineales bacterium]